MRKWMAVGMMVIGIIIPLSATDWSAVYRQVVKDSLEWVVYGEYSCSGEVVAKNRVLTAAHCFSTDNDTLIKVFPTQTSVYYTATIKKIDKYMDLALLDTLTPNKKPIVLADTNPVPGEELAGIGFHGNSSPVIFSANVVSVPVGVDGTTNLIPISHPLLHGMSGGPLVNHNGELVGVNVESNPIVGFSVPIETIRAFLQEK